MFGIGVPVRAPRSRGAEGANTFAFPDGSTDSAPPCERSESMGRRLAPLLAYAPIMTDAEFLAHIDTEMRALMQLGRELNIDENEFAAFRQRYDKLRVTFDKMLAKGISDETKDQVLEWLNSERASVFDRRPHNRS